MPLLSADTQSMSEVRCLCCRRVIASPGQSSAPVKFGWCTSCVRHIDPEYAEAAERRTYEAQFGRPCPFVE
jgi:hypothetical protein